MKTLEVNSKTYGLIQIKLDDEDFERISNMGKWSVSKDRGKFYFHKRVSKKEKITLHRFILNFPKGLVVDHINGDTLDNRKSNLRACTNRANIRNGKLRTNNTSGFTGIYKLDTNEGLKYQSRIRVNYEWIELGTYFVFDDAVKARQNAEKVYWNV